MIRNVRFPTQLETSIFASILRIATVDVRSPLAHVIFHIGCLSPKTKEVSAGCARAAPTDRSPTPRHLTRKVMKNRTVSFHLTNAYRRPSVHRRWLLSRTQSSSGSSSTVRPTRSSVRTPGAETHDGRSWLVAFDDVEDDQDDAIDDDRVGQKAIELVFEDGVGVR